METITMTTSTTTTTTIVAVRMPLPDWTSSIINSVRDDCRNITKNVVDIDVIKIRKTLNQNEDAFIKSTIQNYLNIIDKGLRDYFTESVKDIITAIKNLHTITCLGTDICNTDSFSNELSIKEHTLRFPFYLYEGDLKLMDEWKMIESVSEVSSSKMAQIKENHKDDFILHIAEVINQELRYTLTKYIEESNIQLEFDLAAPEPLGKLRNRRRNVLFIFKLSGTEGDYIRNHRDESYQEESRKMYTSSSSKFDENSGRTYYNKIRPRTVKFTVSLKINPFEFPEIKEALDELSRV